MIYKEKKNFDDYVLCRGDTGCCSLGSSDGYKEMSLFPNWYTYKLKSETYVKKNHDDLTINSSEI